MRLIVCLEDRNFVFWSSTDSVLAGHDFTKLVKALKYVYPNSSIEPCGLQQP